MLLSSNWYFPLKILTILALILSTLILTPGDGWSFRQLAAIVDGIEARGYRIVPLSELMRYPTLRP